MKKLSLKGARIAASVFMAIIIGAVFLACFLPEKTVTLVGGESYAPIYNGSRKNAKVSLMFNVYEGTQIVNQILDVLNKYGVKSTFFVGGCWADDNDQTLKRIVSEGHEIANHGYFHLNHKKLDEKRNTEEIEMTHRFVKAVTSVEMNLFAPPSGAFSVTTLKVAEKLGYKTVMWTKDTIDWRDADSNLVYDRAVNDIQNGDLVLMHPKEHTLKALPLIIDYYKEKDIRAVTVSECIKDD